MTPKAYAAIRKAKDDGHEFVDISAISGLLEVAADRAEQARTLCPNWHDANPVVRIAIVELTERAS